MGDVEVTDYRDVLEHGFVPPSGRALADVTGLAKPVLFDAVRRVLIAEGRIWVAHTLAESHYPLSEEIVPVFEAEREHDVYALLEALDKIWSGEEASYGFDRLLRTEADETRRRLLIASASPKHQRLLSLVDERDFDRIAILAPTGETARSRLARLAAEVAVGGATESSIEEVGSNDLEEVLNIVARDYQRWYVNGGYDFELGLTGSKLHAVAFAAAAAALKISQCWYVRPARFDPEHFTRGVGETHFFALEMPTATSIARRDTESADDPTSPVSA